MAAGLAEPARAADGIAFENHGTPRVDLWSGGEAFRHVWSLYSGASISPFGGIQDDGLRLRAVGGYGVYHYSSPRAVGPGSETVKFRGTASFVDLLLGYHQQLGPLTIKVFGGLTLAQHQITPDDPETAIRGRGEGGKAVLEAWWTISDRAWSSMDLSWGSLYDSYGARLRLGWRFMPTLSAGLEVGAVGNVECDIARIGVFVRHEWAGGELGLSGGIANDKVLDGIKRLRDADANGPYATVTWLSRF